MKLKEKYGDDLYFAELGGRSDIICFASNTNEIINDVWYQNRHENVHDEGKRIITTAAKLIIAEIKRKTFECEEYPSNEEIRSLESGGEWLTPCLRLMMESLMPSYPLKQISIGQAIVHAMRPRSTVPPVLFGLGVEMDHVFGSKWVNQELSRLGFAVTPDEVYRYKQSVVCNESISDYLLRNLKGSFYHWIADNVDHNFATLDGKGTLHAMGILLATMGAKGSYKVLPKIQRRKISKVSEVIHKRGIPLLSYIAPNVSGLSKVFLKPRSELRSGHDTRDCERINLLWHSAHFFKKHRPG